MVRPALEAVALQPGTLAIGDLHLDLAVDADAERFAAWLDSLEAPRLVILGDLFEYWIGPAHARTSAGRTVLASLRRAVDRGVAVDVIPGNRDFLLDEAFSAASGARLRRDGLLGTSGTARVLFVHGDELCTLDRGYQRLRRVLRSRALTWLAPRLPRSVAERVARRLRRASRSAVAAKPRAEKEQQADACRALAAREGADVLVCGHAHRFRDEAFEGLRWLVVDAFGGKRDTLVWQGEGRFVATRHDGAAGPPESVAPGTPQDQVERGDREDPGAAAPAEGSA